MFYNIPSGFIILWISSVEIHDTYNYGFEYVH